MDPGTELPTNVHKPRPTGVNKEKRLKGWWSRETAGSAGRRREMWCRGRAASRSSARASCFSPETNRYWRTVGPLLATTVGAPRHVRSRYIYEYIQMYEYMCTYIHIQYYVRSGVDDLDLSFLRL